MSWVKRHGIEVWDGAQFPEPTDTELAPYQYHAARPVPSCGTEPAYRRHLRDGTTPCESCKQASRDASRERTRKARS